MEFQIENTVLHIDSDKKRISLSSAEMNLDGMKLEMAWEYEKWGFLAYVLEEQEMLIAEFRVEGYSTVFLPSAHMNLSDTGLEFLWDVDILILPGDKSSIPMIEKIEPRLIVAYGEGAHEIGTHLGVVDEPEKKHKLKDTDLSADKTNCIILA
jgi:hypothetical protein